MSILATGDQATVQVLRNEIRHLEAVSRQDQGQVYSTGCVAVDCWLPKGGLGAGTVTEWLTPQTKGAFGAKPGSVLAGGKQDGHAAGGYGAEILSLIATREACAAGGALVVIDPWHQFYPPAAAAWGISLEHTLVLRCRDPKEMLWAIDQALRCSAVAVVWGWLGRVEERWLRRFQLSAEETGTMGMFIRSTQVRQQPSWSDVQWMVDPGRVVNEKRRAVDERRGEVVTKATFSREIPLRLWKCRGGVAGAAAWLEVDFTSGWLQVASSFRTHSNSNRVQDHETCALPSSTLLAYPAVSGCQ